MVELPDDQNSSDEAIEATVKAAAEAAEAAWGSVPYGEMAERSWPDAIRAAWPFIAARVRAEAQREVQGWMALDLWVALGRDSEAAPDPVFGAWAEMLAAVRLAEERQRMLEHLHEQAQLLPVERAQWLSTWLAGAAGSVPVATPERCEFCAIGDHETCRLDDADDAGHGQRCCCPGPVATPRAPAVDDVRAAAKALLRWCDDETASPTVLGSILAGLRGPVATPPAKLTCEHRRDVAHSVDPTPAQMFWREYPPYCPGPVATPRAPTVDDVRAAAKALLRWCDDETASPTVLGSILAGLRGPVATPTEPDEHAPWSYTEFGVICCCGAPMDQDENCLRAAPPVPAEQPEER